MLQSKIVVSKTVVIKSKYNIHIYCSFKFNLTILHGNTSKTKLEV